MNYAYISPPVPNLARWRHITSRYRGLSLIRMMEYELLEHLQLSGRVLDMGGGANATYLKVLPKGATIESANIDPKIEPTYLIEPDQRLPFDDNTFDAVICFNTLEHIYDAAGVLGELFRVVKPGGKVYIMVPLMFRIHGHPDDYNRPTPSWWRETSRRCGFSGPELMPLVWGRRSRVSVVPGLHGPFPRLRLHLAMLLDILTAKLLLKGDTISGRRGDSICGTSPGWFMTGTK